MVKALPGSASPPHHPAAFVLPFVLVGEHARFLELAKRRIPKMKMENLALARQEVVFNVEPLHGFKMALEHGNRNQVRDRCRLVVPFFNGVQRCGASLQVRLVLFVPMRDAGIKIPADIIESRRTRPALRFQRATSSRYAGIPRPRRRPAPRCCRYSSERPLPCPQIAAGGRNVSPRMALRRCPICAALLGLILECSTSTLPGKQRGSISRRGSIGGERVRPARRG